MKEELVSFEVAKLAKEIGFAYEFNKQLPEYVPIFYCESDNDGNLDLTTLKESECQGEDIVRGDFYFRSTKSLLQKWLREVHNIYVECAHDLTSNGKDIRYVASWGFMQQRDINGEQNVNGWFDEHNDWKTYEEALEIGLLEALKLIKVPSKS